MNRFGNWERAAAGLCLLFLAGIWLQWGMPAKAQRGGDMQMPLPVYNNGGYMVKAGEITYWSRPPILYTTKRCEGSIVYSSDGEKWETLWETGYADTKLYSDGFSLYFGSWEEQHGDMVYRMDLSSREVRPLCNGEIQYYDREANQFYLEITLSEYQPYEELDGLYRYDIASGDMVKVLDKGEAPILFDGDCIYYTAQEGCELWRADTDSGRKEMVIREESDGSSYAWERICGLEKAGGRLVYSFGSFQGSAAVFYGNYCSVKEDGSDKRVYPADQAQFFAFGGYVCVNKGYQAAPPAKQPGYYCLSPDFSREFYMEEVGAVISYDREGDWVYYEGKIEGQEALAAGADVNKMQAPDLCRMHSDGSGKQLLIRGDEVTFGLEKESDKCGYRHVQAVDGRVYAEMECWGYRGYSGWRDDFLERRVYCAEQGKVSLVQSVTAVLGRKAASGEACLPVEIFSARLRSWIDRYLHTFLQRREMFAYLKDAESPDLWPGRLTAAVYEGGKLEIRHYDTKEEFLVRYGFSGEEPYFAWYGEDGSLQTEVYYKEETGKGCGIRYVKEKGAEHGGRLPRGFVFEHTVEREWAKPDPWLVRTADGKDGSEAVEQFREACTWTPEGKMLSYHSTGVLDYYGMEPIHVIDVVFRYREDKSLESKEYWQSAEVFGSSGARSGYCRYGQKGELLYESIRHFMGNYEYYYIYGEDAAKPSFCLELDNRMGYWIAAEFAGYR